MDLLLVTLAYPCNCGAGGHPPSLVNKAAREGAASWKRCTSSPYLFCAQLSAAFDAGYTNARGAARKAGA